LSLSIIHIPQIWPCVTFFLFPKLSIILRGKVVYDFVSLKEKSWITLAKIKTWDFIDAPSSGTVTEFTVSVCKGTALKEIV
jgi:hypothetical protein